MSDDPTWLEVELAKHDPWVSTCPCNLCQLAHIFYNEWTINHPPIRIDRSSSGE